MSRSLLQYFSSEIFLSLGIGASLYVQPFFYRSLGFSDSTIGWLFAVSSVFAGLSALFLGTASDWIGASRVFKFATALIGVNMLVMALSHTLTMLILTAAVSGIGTALLTSTENVVLSALTHGQERAAVLSKFVALYMAVIGIGAVAAGFLSAATSYRTALFTAALVALVAPWIRYFVVAPDAKADRIFRIPNRRTFAMSVYTILFGVGLGVFNPFATLILQGQFGLGDRVTAALSASSNFMVSCGAFMVSALLRRFRSQKTLLLAFAVGIGLTLGMAFTGNVVGFALLYLLRTAAMSIPGSIVDAKFLDFTSPTEYSQMFGVRVFGSNVGTAVGQSLGGTLLDHGNITWPLITSGIGFTLAFGYLYVLLTRLRRSRGMDSSASVTAPGRPV